MRKVTPNPSPGNSDAEHEFQESFNSTSGKKKRRSIRKRKPSPPPAVLINGEEPGGIKERSNTMPQNSPSNIFGEHCMKSVQIRSFFWSLFSGIRTIKNFVSGHFSRNGKYGSISKAKSLGKCLFNV